MKTKILMVFFGAFSIVSYSQPPKVAILDFENVTGNADYDGLGKAMSNMIITDLKNNIHPKKVEFFERTQLNKLLEEQELQKSKNFDPQTAVDFGKISGVNYVFVGSIFVLNENCNITSKLVDVKTSQVVVAKEVNGLLDGWLQLKTELAEALAIELKNPITLSKEYKDDPTNLVTLNQYGKILSIMDEGDVEKAEQMRSVFEETNPKFKYFKDVKDDINRLKVQVEKNTADIEVLNKSGGRVVNATSPREIVMNIANPLTSYDDAALMITELLKSDIGEVKSAVFDRFETVWLPSVLPSRDLDDSFVSKNISFLTNCLDNNDLNVQTCSYYVFQKFRNYARLLNTKKENASYQDWKTQLIKLGEKLKNYNSNYKILSYESQYFEISTFKSSDGSIQIMSPMDSDKFARNLTANDFDIDWILAHMY